jgi:hypothetical protein
VVLIVADWPIITLRAVCISAYILESWDRTHVNLARSRPRQARCGLLIRCFGAHERAKAGPLKGASGSWMRRGERLGALLEAEHGVDNGRE